MPFNLPADSESRPRREGRKSAVGAEEVGDFYAPFFDVVFYKAEPNEVLLSEASDFLPGARSITRKASAILRGILDTGTSVTLGDNPFKVGASSLRIRTKDGFTSFTSDDSAEIYNFRTHLTIEARAAAAYRATLTLNPPYEAALKLIDSRAIQYGALMGVKWGYLSLDGSGPVISDEGIFSIVQPTCNFGRSITIQISGWDVYYASAQTSVMRRKYERKGDTATDLGVFKKVVERVAPSIEVDSSALEALTDEKTKKKHQMLEEKTGTPLVQAKNDKEFMFWLLDSNDVAYEIKGDRMILYDIGERELRDPKFTLMWYAKPTEPTHIPMKEFSTNAIPSLFAATGSAGFFSYSTDTFKGKVDKKTHSTSDTKTGSTGGGRSQATPEQYNRSSGKVKVGGKDIQSLPSHSRRAKDEGQTGAIETLPDQSPNKEQVRDNIVSRLKRIANTTAEAVIPGHPGVVPLMNVRIEGLGETFSGTYRIMKASHEVGIGYTTKLDLLRSSSTGSKTDSKHAKTRDPANPGTKGTSTTNVETPKKEGPSSTPPKRGN